MRKNDIENAAKECVKKYFSEDKMVMIDISIMRIKGIMFYIYDLIYFGNKILISKNTLKKIKRSKLRVTYQIVSSNCSYFLDSMARDDHSNYKIIDLDEYGKSSIDKIERYLKENENTIYFLENQRLYQRLVARGLEKQLRLLNVRMKMTSILKNEMVRFSTLGAIKHEDNSMTITKREGTTLIKVYKPNGEEKEGNKVTVEVNDIVFMRSDKEVKYSFNLYRVVTKHTRNQVINIIWTDMLKGEKTNFYVQRLDEKYRKIIENNAQ